MTAPAPTTPNARRQPSGRAAYPDRLATERLTTERSTSERSTTERQAAERLAKDLASAVQARGGRTERLADEVVDAVRLLSRAVGAQQPVAAPPAFEKLRPRHIQVLRLLAAQPGLSVRVAAETLKMRPHNLSTLLTDLVGAGLVERRGDPRDRRIARLYLCEEARAQVEGVERGLHDAVVGALGRLTDVDQGRIRAALPALLRLVTGLTETADPTA
jgi:DNA-binding MarR family transcriptional regulator